MLTETIAKDSVLLISGHMPTILGSSIDLIKNTQIEHFKRASNLWTCIKKEFQKTEVAKNILLDLEKTPSNEIVQAIFRHQLSTHLKKDDDFAWRVEQLLYIQDFKTPIRTAFLPNDSSQAQKPVHTNKVHPFPMPLVHPTIINAQEVHPNRD